ncbi:MAG: UvrD-helicase domain-containing protein [Betaproteobacteria bacterium]|nr:UvrD-helicase domain-containing protein [Betaproteobacteria bacterium]
MSPAFLSGLNPQQLEAVTLPDGSALVLAGAGSGKTRVLTTRVAWLIATGQVSPMGLVAVTFTNKAAREMLTRISAMLPIATRGMWVGTFHGLCNRLLRAHYRDAGLPQLFQILDSQDQLAAIKRLLKSLNVDEERFAPRQLQWFLAANKEEGRRAAEVEAHDDFTRRMAELYAAYDEQCQREGTVDFAELLLRCHELLSRNETLRSHYRGRFRHILVDEFQDTNRLQYRWLKLLAAPEHGARNAIFAVGDDDQCLVRGTRIAMADGSTKAIERVRRGDRVLSCFGKDDFRAAEVTAVFRRERRQSLVTIVTRRRREITSTPEHTHFAGYLLGTTPQTADYDLDPGEPYHVPCSRNSSRRNITVTLCGDNRGRSVLHRICVMGNDASGRRALRKLGLSVRPAKKRSQSWRFETAYKDFGAVTALAVRIKHKLGGRVLLRAGFASEPIPFIRARCVRPGMAMVGADGKLDIIKRVVREPVRETTVFDLNVSPVHNFIANGLVTHNSIYAFRGASAANMADLRRDFAIERVIKLEQNYRSHGNILDAANALIRHNRNRLGKNLWTADDRGEPLRVYEAATDAEEAGFIIEEVKALAAGGVRLADVAVLYRSNAQSRVLEHALFNAALPYRVYGGLRFFERQEVKHALAYLRLIANPDDEGALLRVINFPARGVGARTLEQLRDAASGKKCSLWQAGKIRAEGARTKDEKEQPGAATASSFRGVAGFIALVESMRAACAGLRLPEMIEHVIEASGLKLHYQAEKEGADRLENLAELVNAAAVFVVERDVHPAGEGAGIDEPDELTAFLAHAALEAGEHQAEAGADALQLMTVHAAKGLEFHGVFISGLEEGLFPHENSLTEADGLEEERRLMYVALTRAKRRLYLSFAQSRLLHGSTRYGIPSRFFHEIPEGLMRRINPRFEFRVPASAVQGSRFKVPGSGSKAERPGISTLNIEPGTLNARHATQWRVGQSVVHPKFGMGVIVNAEGRGADARVHVNFRDAGLKWLMLEYAKLAPA